MLAAFIRRGSLIKQTLLGELASVGEAFEKEARRIGGFDENQTTASWRNCGM